MNLTVRKVTSADFYRFAREELVAARIALMMLETVAIRAGEGAPPAFVDEARADGFEMLFECLERADGWRALARKAREQGL